VNNKLDKIKEKYSNKAFAWEIYMNYTDHFEWILVIIYHDA